MQPATLADVAPSPDVQILVITGGNQSATVIAQIERSNGVGVTFEIKPQERLNLSGERRGRSILGIIVPRLVIGRSIFAG